jgi:hypothetical protein
MIFSADNHIGNDETTRKYWKSNLSSGQETVKKFRPLTAHLRNYLKLKTPVSTITGGEGNWKD